MSNIEHIFMDHIPLEINEGILYISIKFKVAIHMCVCGCGNKVVTPLSPSSWSLNYDGETVSLHPSIGNWNYSCQSHYWIIENKVIHATKWSKNKIEKAKENEFLSRKKYFDQKHNLD